MMVYPAGEPHVNFDEGKLYMIGEVDTIIAEAYNFNQLAIIRTAATILIRNGYNPEWVIPYFPFARHDRRNDQFDGLELELAIGFMHGIPVTIIDPHSDVAGLLPNYHQGAFVHAALSNGLGSGKLFAIPDNGASKKAYNWAEYFDIETIQCSKRRNTRTGKLSGFEVHGDVKGRDVVIVDDICDGGGTFIGLADKLWEGEVKTLSLAVTHGLFTQGVHKMLNCFDRIYTLENQWNEVVTHDRLKKIQVEEVISRKSWKR